MIATNCTLYPSHHRSGNTSETFHMTYRPHCYIFLSLSLVFYLTHPFAVQPIADHRTTRLGPYHTFHHTWTLCLCYLSFVFQTFVSTLKKKEVFPQNSDSSSFCLIVSLCSVFAPLLYLVLPTPFTLSHRPEPSSHTTLHSLTLHQETISLLPNCTPQNHIGYTLRSPSPLIFVTS